MLPTDYESYDDLLTAVRMFAADAVTRCGSCVVLVSNFSRMTAVKKHLAQAQCGFGVQVETASSFLADLWELYGDGRSLARALDRDLLIRSVLQERSDARVTGAFIESTGVVNMIGQLARDAASAAHEALAQRDSFSTAEQEALLVTDAYLDLLHQSGMVEVSEACHLLAQQGVLKDAAVMAADCSTTVAHDELLESAGELSIARQLLSREKSEERAPELRALSQVLFAPQFDDPLIPQGSVRFALPAGRYAQNACLANALVESAERAHAQKLALTAKDPCALFVSLAPLLQEAGFQVEVDARVSLGRTSFGIAWLSLLDFCLDARHATAAWASDFAASSFSFMSRSSAQWLDARMRGWRGETLDQALEDLEGCADEDHRDFIAAVEQGNLTEALEIQRAWVAQKTTWPEAYRGIQLAAIDYALQVHQRAAELGLPLSSAREIIASHALPYHCCVRPENVPAEEGLPSVLITTQQQLANFEPASFDVVLLADLTAGKYPLSVQAQALDALLQKLNAYKEPCTVERMRAAFAACIAAARNELLLSRCLNTVDAEEERPAALLDELVDCYRRDPKNADELQKPYGIAKVLVPFAVTQGEDDFGEIFAHAADSRQERGSYLVAPTGKLARFEGETSLLMAPKVNGEGIVQPPHLSASAIETYLECPYKWFAQRRVGLETLDAEMGPLAKGNFAHELFERFHGALREGGLTRVTPENEKSLSGLFDKLFEELVDEQARSFKPDAVFAVSALDQIEIDRLRRNLREFITWEAKFLPGFAPYGEELSFGRGEQGPFEYAGVPLVGSIDRVDVDAFGRAAVLDYKGSVGDKYYFRPKDVEGFALPKKIQALIYAQVVRRAFGLQPVAALYVSYGAKKGAAGLYDQTCFNNTLDLLGVSSSRCGTAAFCDDLDRVEEAVAERLELFKKGVIEPHPFDADSCTYCPVLNCDGRGGEGGTHE